MLAPKKSSGKLNTEMFDDVPVLQRKWQAALRPGEGLPRYEDVMLGSLGRMADHIVLLKENNGALEVSRTGRYIQKWLNDDRHDIPVSALSPDCATALSEAATCALANGRPYLAAAHCVREGLVQTYDVLALPTSSRWGHTLIGAYVNERAPQYNLLDKIFSATDEGVLSLAAIRDPEGRPFDFQIVHHNEGASRLLKVPSTDLLWHRLSARGNLLCSQEVVERLLEAVKSGNRDQFEIDSDDRNLKLGATAFGDILSLTVSDVTESLFLAETEANIAILHQLRELGVSISMDDFGTGYSSLSYLRSFPFDKIKIDRSFVKDIAERPDCVAIVRAISGLGRSLNITTTAEGVETIAQLDWLRAEGCNEVQGFLFSAAKPAAEVNALLFKFGRRASQAA
jgi:EAL domain